MAKLTEISTSKLMRSLRASAESANPDQYALDALLKETERRLNPQFVVYYPPGEIEDQNGNTVGSHVLAKKILDSLTATGSIALPIPFVMDEEIEEGLFLGDPAWRVEILASAPTDTFVLDRLASAGWKRSGENYWTPAYTRRCREVITEPEPV